LSVPGNACQPRRNVEVIDEENEEMEFSMLRIGCASGVCLVILLGTYNMVFAPVSDVNPNHLPRMPALKPKDYPKLPAFDSPPVQEPFPGIVDPDVVGFPSDKGFVKKPPVNQPFPKIEPRPVKRFPSDQGFVKKPPGGRGFPKNPNNRPPRLPLPKKKKEKWYEEDFDKTSSDDDSSTSDYDPLANVDPKFIWDGTEQPKETLFDEEDTRPLPLPIKIEPKGFVPPNLNNPKKVVGDGMYDPNWDRPRFVKEKEAVDTYDDDDDDYLYAPIDDSIPSLGKNPIKVANGNWDRPRFVKEKTMPAIDDFSDLDEYNRPLSRKNPRKVGKGSFDRPNFSNRPRNRAPVKNDLAPEWDNEDFYAPKYSNKKKERNSFKRRRQAVEW